MLKLSKWIMSHKIAIIVVFVLLLVAALIGNNFVNKESDLIAYLSEDTDAMISKKLLENEYNIIGDGNIAISYLSKEEVAEIIKEIKKAKIDTGESIGSILAKDPVWIGTFDDLSEIPEIDTDMAFENVQEKFVKTTEVTFTNKNGETVTKNVDTYIIALYFETAGGDDETIAALNKIDEIITNYIEKEAESEGPAKTNEWYYIGGNAQNARTILQSSLGDMPKFFIVAILVCFVILLFTTHSYLEPLIFLATLGISILLNMGSNVIAGNPMGTISSITSSCATILQLAIAMDYSIFLMHTYYEELKLTPSPKQALIAALPKTISAISASALTTVGGFIALFFMDYGIGYDLGFVLAKGVILSLLSVVFLQPILILVFNKIIAKTKHKWSVTPRLKFVSKNVTKPAVAIIVTVLILAVALPCSYFQLKVPLNYVTTTAENPSPSMPEQQTLLINNQAIVMVPYTGADSISSHYKFVEEVRKVGYELDENGEIKLDENGNPKHLKDINYVTEVFSLATIISEEDFNKIEAMPSGFKSLVYNQLHSSFISNIKDNVGKINFDENGNVISYGPTYMLYTININSLLEDGTYKNLIETDLTYNALKEIKSLAISIFGLYDADNHADPYVKVLDAEAQYGVDSQEYKTALEEFKDYAMHSSTKSGVYLTGLSQGAYELNQVTPNDFLIVSFLSAAIVLVILLFTFKSVKLSLILILVIESGIWINLSIVYFASMLQISSMINFVAYLIVTAIELGATVDYAIMLTSKYIEEKKAGVKSVQAVKNAIGRAAPSVTTSAFILIGVCACVNLITTNIIVAQITRLIAIGTSMSYVFVFTLLPAILSLNERVMRKRSIKKGLGDPDEGRFDYNPQFYNEDGTPLEVEEEPQPAVELAVAEGQIIDNIQDDNIQDADDMSKANDEVTADVAKKPKKTKKSKK